MTHDSDPERARTRQAHLEALAHARAAHDTILAGSTRWIVLAAIVLVGVWAFAGYLVAMYTGIAAAILWLALAHRERIVRFRASQHANAARASAAAVETALLQVVTDDVAPWLRVGHDAPFTAQTVNDSGLVPAHITTLSSSRSLSGTYDGRTTFHAAHVEGVHVWETRDWRKPRRRHYDVVFRGLFAVMEFPAPQEAGTLTPAVAAQVHAFLRQYPESPCSIAIRDNALTLVIPMHDSPFSLRNNPEMWEQELQTFEDTVVRFSRLVETMHSDVLYPPMAAAQ